MMPAPVFAGMAHLVPCHPNEFDLRRIQRAIGQRERYRYVEPTVLPIDDGYRIECACCSRTVRPDGGIVDIALIRWSDTEGAWLLFARNHELDRWDLDSGHDRLDHLLAQLNRDPDRRFWQ